MVHLGKNNINCNFIVLICRTFLQTYNQDHQTPDSAGTATQFLCGIKTNSGVLGVDGSVKPKDCSSMTDKSKVTSIADWSIQKGKTFYCYYV